MSINLRDTNYLSLVTNVLHRMYGPPLANCDDWTSIRGRSRIVIGSSLLRRLDVKITTFSKVLGVALVVAGCSDSPLALGDLPNIEGAWTFTENASATGGVSNACSSFGMLAITQDGEVLAGTFTRSESCISGLREPLDAGARSSSNNQSGRLQDGQVAETTVRFRIEDCEYRGTFEGTPVERFEGTALCSRLTTTGFDKTETRIWRAERLGSE